ncbi:MAG: hypothetical protein ACOY5V_18545 [Pseudomonadota bacterium]
MFGLFKRHKLIMDSEEVKARFWLAMNDRAQVDATARAIRRIVGSKLTDEQCRKCAEAIAVKWIALVAGGKPDTDNVARMVRNGHPLLSEIEVREIVRLVSEARFRPYHEVVARIRELKTGAAAKRPSQVREAATQSSSPLYLNADSAEKVVELASNAGKMQVPMGVLMMLLLVARQSGWAGGADLFEGAGDMQILKSFSKATISGRDARSLCLELEPYVAAAPPSAEAQLLREFLALLDGSDLHISVR